MIKRFIIIIPVLLATLTGCSVFNPYDSDFLCPKPSIGKCANMDEAYHDSIDNELVIAPVTSSPGCIDCDNSGKAESEVGNVNTYDPETAYKHRVFNEMANMIGDEDSPIIQPPKTMRMLVLNYEGDAKILYGHRFVYFLVGEPEWVVNPTR